MYRWLQRRRRSLEYVLRARCAGMRFDGDLVAQLRIDCAVDDFSRALKLVA